MRRGSLWVLLLGPMILASCGPMRGEPTNGQLQLMLKLNRQVWNELRDMFEEDMSRNGLRLIGPSAHRNTMCRDRRRGSDCLSFERWKKYALRLEFAGIQWIQQHDSQGVYFEVYRRSPVWGWSGAYRSRGLVFAPESPQVTHNSGDIEERVDFGDGWYGYLNIDE